MKHSFKIRHVFNNEKGAALISVIFIFLLLTIMGMSMLALTTNNLKLSTKERSSQSTYYIAEAGATFRLNEIETKINDYYEETKNENEFFLVLENDLFSPNPPLKTFEHVFGETPEANITVTKLNNTNPRTYKIVSEGKIGGDTRTVEQIFSVAWTSKGNLNIPHDMAVFVDSTISLTGGASINGNLGTNSLKKPSITMDGGASIKDGYIFVPSSDINGAVQAPQYMWDNNSIPRIISGGTTSFELPPFPTFPDYPVHEDVNVKKSEYNHYDVIKNGHLRVDNWVVSEYTLKLINNTSFAEIKLDSNYTLNIDTGDSDKSIVVDDLNITNGNLNILGSGKLTIYVRGQITMGAGSTVNQGKSFGKINVYLQGSSNANRPKKLKLGGAQKIYGSLFAEDADIEISGGGGFQGHIFTGGKQFLISGGARAISSLLYAPYANFSLSGGGSVVGSIISKSFTASGGAWAKFENFEYETIPFIPSNGIGLPENMLSKEAIREI